MRLKRLPADYRHIQPDTVDTDMNGILYRPGFGGKLAPNDKFVSVGVTLNLLPAVGRKILSFDYYFRFLTFYPLPIYNKPGFNRDYRRM